MIATTVSSQLWRKAGDSFAHYDHLRMVVSWSVKLSWSDVVLLPPKSTMNKVNCVIKGTGSSNKSLADRMTDWWLKWVCMGVLFISQEFGLKNRLKVALLTVSSISDKRQLRKLLWLWKRNPIKPFNSALTLRVVVKFLRINLLIFFSASPIRRIPSSIESFLRTFHVIYLTSDLRFLALQ